MMGIRSPRNPSPLTVEGFRSSARISPCLSPGGKHAFLDQLFAEFDAVVVVDVEQGDGDAADRRAADQVWPFPAEMRRPFVAAGVEQRRELAGFLVSMPLISEPLNELQRKQLKARLPATVGPWCFLERMWSISNGRSSDVLG